MADYSFITNAHPEYIENLYTKYQQQPDGVEESWRTFFKGFDYALNSNGHSTNDLSSDTAATLMQSNGTDAQQLEKEFRVLSLIKGYRNRGHLEADTNPIRQRKDREAHLELEDFGLQEADLDRSFVVSREAGLQNATLKDLIAHLRKVYCGHIGFEYHHINDRKKRRWIRERIEAHSPEKAFNIPMEKKHRILEKLNGAVVFEEFLHKKYIGQKRFSLEGGESTIVALDAIISAGAERDVQEVIIGMAHRGRLNVLVNIMQKTYKMIFSEFEEVDPGDMSFGDGDVKYHLGYSSQVTTPQGKNVHLKLVPNPSHLESVDPVVEGFSRAKADILYESDYDKIMPILIHGDAAVAGQGVVYETVQMSQLEGYYTGGTVHFVINNQIGFTTTFEEARSSTYSTAAAGLVQAPVFHVNGDDPEAVLFAAEFATEYRQEFNNDVFIDLVCYRKHGHNEGDDPKFTNPKLYDLIENHRNPREIYRDLLAQRGDIEKEMAEKMETEFWAQLQDRLDEVREKNQPYSYQPPEKAWQQLKRTKDPADFAESPATGIERERVDQILDHLMTMPEGLNPLRKIKRLMKTW